MNCMISAYIELDRINVNLCFVKNTIEARERDRREAGVELREKVFSFPGIPDCVPESLRFLLNGEIGPLPLHF